MLDYLAERHGNRPSVNENERAELEFLRKEVPMLKEKLEQISPGVSTGAESDKGSDSCSDSEEEHEVHELVQNSGNTLQVAPQGNRKPRASVSAEAFGNWNKKGDFKAPVIPKSQETKTALKQRLEQAFMFSALNPEELEIVLGAMNSATFRAGEAVIK
jgi:hypothetical protein